MCGKTRIISINVATQNYNTNIFIIYKISCNYYIFICIQDDNALRIKYIKYRYI